MRSRSDGGVSQDSLRGRYATLTACAVCRLRGPSGEKAPGPGHPPVVDQFGSQDLDGLPVLAVLTVKEPQCTYRECLGPETWSNLPEAVRDALSCPMQAEGKADVVNGASWFSWLLVRLFNLPREGKNQALTLETSWDGEKMVWRRVFDGRTFLSKQVVGAGRLIESVGLSQLEFAVETEGSKVVFTSGRVKVLGIVLPSALRPVTTATLQAAGDGWESKVCISAPLVGLLCEYVAAS